MRILLVSLLLISCSKSSSSDPAPAAASTSIDTIDITDAKGLFITGADPAGLYLADSTVLKPGTLYKTTSAGVVKEVTYSVGGVIKTDTSAPISVVQPDPRIVLMDFGTSLYIVNKATGKAFEAKGDSYFYSVQDDGKTDETPITMYGMKTGPSAGIVSKIEFSDDITITQLSAEGDNIGESGFLRDSTNAIIYNPDTGFKMRSPEGKFSNLSDLSCVGKSGDGRLLGFIKEKNRLTQVTNAVTGAVVATVPDFATLGFDVQACGNPKARIGNKAINIGAGTGTVLEIFDETAGTFEHIPSPTFFNNGGGIQLQASDKYVYGIAGGKIQRVDITAKTTTPVEIPNLLEVRGFLVAKDDSITVNGTLDDGSSFMGTVSPTGTFTQTSKVGSGAVTIIKPLD